MGKLTTCLIHPDRDAYCRELCHSCYVRLMRRGTTEPAYPPKPELHEPDVDGYTFDPMDSRHGERTSYVNFGCRCLACTEANNIYIANYRSRT